MSQETQRVLLFIYRRFSLLYFSLVDVLRKISLADNFSTGADKVSSTRKNSVSALDIRNHSHSYMWLFQ